MTTNTNTAPADIYDLSLKALTEYLKDCDEHAIEPDVGGAFANAFRAGAALSAAQQPAQKENNLTVETKDGCKGHMMGANCPAGKAISASLNMSACPVPGNTHPESKDIARQSALNAEWLAATEKTKASGLTDAEIARLAKNTHADLWGEGLFRFARAIEAAHGIGAHKEQA